MMLSIICMRKHAPPAQPDHCKSPSASAYRRICELPEALIICSWWLCGKIDSSSLCSHVHVKARGAGLLAEHQERGLGSPAHRCYIALHRMTSQQLRNQATSDEGLDKLEICNGGVDLETHNQF